MNRILKTSTPSMWPTVVLLIVTIVQVSAQVGENDFSYNINTGFNNTVNASAIDANGKLVVGGAFTLFNGTTRNYIARLNTDGTLDGTFDAAAALNGAVSSIIIESSGTILVAGTFGGSIKRLTSTGAVDDSFTASAFNDVVYSIAVQPSDGKIIVVGNFTTYNATARNRVLRLETSGTLDATFDPAAVGLNGIVRCVKVVSGGQVVVGGSFTSPRFYYARLNSNGTLDGTFSSGAFGSTSAGASGVYALATQSNGQIIAAGIYFNGVYLGTTRRLNSDGTNDGTFAASTYTGSIVKSVAVQSNDKVIAGGEFAQNIVRYTTTGTIDPFVAGNGFAGSSGVVNTISVQSDGKVIAGGSFTAYNDNVRSNIARLTACPGVVVTTQPTNQAICAAGNGAFSLIATGTGLTYQWQYAVTSVSAYSNVTDGGVYSGATTSTLNLTGVTAPMTNYFYRCIVKDATCNTTSAAVVLTVNTVQSISADPVNKSICVNANTSFTATVTGSQGAFQWQEDQGSGFVNLSNGGVYSNVTTTSLSLSGVTLAMNSYKYRLVASLCSPTATSNFATLTVSDMPGINTQPIYSTGICQPNTNPINLSIAATGTALTYQWQRYNGSNTYLNLADGALAAGTFNAGGTYSGTTTTAMTITNPSANTASATDAALYRCVVSSGGCAVNSAFAFVYFYSTPTITTHPTDVSKCAGANGTGVSTFTIVSPYLAGVTYQWQEKVGSGSFTDLTNSGVYSTVTTTTLTITGAPVGMSGNKYRCVVGTCTSPVISGEAMLTIDSPPVVTLNPVAVTICAGMNATFTASVTMTGGSTKWQKETGVGSGTYADITDGGIYSGATTETLTLTNVPANEHGYRYRYSATASGACPTVYTSNAQLTVRAVPTFTTQPVDKVVCEGQTATISTSVNFNGAPSSYQWQVDEFGIAFTDLTPNTTLYPNGVNSATLSISSTLLQNGYKYRVKVGSCQPDVFSNAAKLTVNQTPTITSQPVDKIICRGETATFSVTAVGSELTYQWIGATGFTGTDTPTITLTDVPSGYNGKKIYCNVRGASGCFLVQSAEVTLTVNDLVITAQPTAVTRFCPGGNAAYTVAAEGPSLTYQWQEDKGNGFADIANTGVYSGATSTTLSLTGASFDMNTYRYRCVVKGLCGEWNSSTVTLSLFPTPPKPTITVNATSNPEAPQLTSSVGGEVCQWFKDGVSISGSGQTISATSAGAYTVKVTANGCTSALSDPQAIIVTGDLENLTSSLIKVFPNPATDQIILSLGGFEKDKPVSISVFDLQGRVIDKTSGPGQREVLLDIRNYASGKYVAWMQQRTIKISQQFIKSDK